MSLKQYLIDRFQLDIEEISNSREYFIDEIRQKFPLSKFDKDTLKTYLSLYRQGKLVIKNRNKPKQYKHKAFVRHKIRNELKEWLK